MIDIFFIFNLVISLGDIINEYIDSYSYMVLRSEGKNNFYSV